MKTRSTKIISLMDPAQYSREVSGPITEHNASMDTEAKGSILFLRVTSKSNLGNNSVSRQTKDGILSAKKRGLKITHVVGHVVSGSNPERPDFDEVHSILKQAGGMPVLIEAADRIGYDREASTSFYTKVHELGGQIVMGALTEKFAKQADDICRKYMSEEIHRRISGSSEN